MYRIENIETLPYFYQNGDIIILRVQSIIYPLRKLFSLSLSLHSTVYVLITDKTEVSKYMYKTLTEIYYFTMKDYSKSSGYTIGNVLSLKDHSKSFLKRSTYTSVKIFRPQKKKKNIPN